MDQRDYSQIDTVEMTAVKIESGQINVYALINDLIRRGLITCLLSIDDHVKFRVKHLTPHSDGWVECMINKDIVLFITKRTPLTLYVSGVLN